MTILELARDVLTSERFRALRHAVAVQSVVRDLPAISLEAEIEEPDWAYVLSCASLLVQADIEEAQDAALRIAQGAIASEGAALNERAAAAILLERMGNRLALRLATAREQLPDEAWTEAPAPLRLDVVRRRLELAIPARMETIEANQFQRNFWTALRTTRWISVSAPTSAGKSFLVKRWFAEQVAKPERFRGVYLVPTRALIEEVSNELRAELPEDVGIYTIPWDPGIATRDREIYVLTQERLHFVHDRLTDFKADLLFIDEAQKFGDGGRGVLLERVLGDAVARNRELQVVFASPMSQNPEVLLQEAVGASRPLTSETITVNQNLLWVDQIKYQPTEWRAQLVSDGEPRTVGTFRLPARPTSVPKRIALVAVALGGGEGGNVVYANGAADAEKVATQIAGALGDEMDVSADDRIAALRELIQQTIHRDYVLADVLKHGVAFHYGNMPLLVRQEVERLFREGALRYLVCTSTLLEGVNLPCRNLFARGPRRGRGTVMSPADFWNLAGRAGRWGKEFEGNIVCIDTSDRDVWPEPPVSRARHPLSRATEGVLSDLDRLREYVAAGAPAEEAKRSRLREEVFSLLAVRVASGESLESLPALRRSDPKKIAALEEAVAGSVAAVEIPLAIFSRHAGISPPAMQRLLEHFRTKNDPVDLLLAPPESGDALESYIKGLARCDKHLASNFGVPGRHFQLALLIVHWMRGHPLARLINDRIKSTVKKHGKSNVAADIRATMQDVEEVARFSAPKYLASYVDVLGLHLAEIDRAELVAEMPNVSMMLELGVMRTTEVSLMALGLSRTAAVALEPSIVPDELTPEECLAWLREANLEARGLPALVRTEIARMLERHAPSHAIAPGPPEEEA
jgi:hypothetical protein